MRPLGRNLQFSSQALVLAPVCVNISLLNNCPLGATDLASNQLGDSAQARFLIETDEIRFHIHSLHQMNTGEQHAIDVQQKLAPSALLFVKQIQLHGHKPDIMMSMDTTDAALRNLL